LPVLSRIEAHAWELVGEAQVGFFAAQFSGRKITIIITD
jgi:hypothetical protein